MRVIIAGGRDFEPEQKHWDKLDELHRCFRFSVVLCGCASGADLFGWRWADKRGVEIEKYPADWKSYGVCAGPKRNRAMAENAHMAILFKGGRGTDSMRREAHKRRLSVIELASMNQSMEF